MDATTRDALRALNRDFYERHALAFDATRDHAWPGWGRVLARLPAGRRSLLDAGCGNGRFARFLAASDRGADVDYLGIDASEALVRVARERCAHAGLRRLRFVRGDLFDDGDLLPGPFDAVVLFGVLHHVPGFEERVRLVARLATRLTAGGLLAATLWRFGADPRAAGHTLAWDTHPARVDPRALEPGDHLLAWGGSRRVARYCHFVDDAEVERLVERCAAGGLRLVDRFRSDGRGGDLNEYLLWVADAVRVV